MVAPGFYCLYTSCSMTQWHFKTVRLKVVANLVWRLNSFGRCPFIIASPSVVVLSWGISLCFPEFTAPYVDAILICRDTPLFHKVIYDSCV